MYPPLFIVLIACVTTILGNTSRISKCSNIICPAVEATICVKIKQTNNNQIQTNYVMMSKCEMKQINCLNDAKTTIVPVKLCKAKSLRDGLIASNDPNTPVIPSENDKKKLTQEDNNKTPDEIEDNDPDGTDKEINDPQETPEDPNDEGDGPEAPQTEEDESNASEIPHEETDEPEDPQVTQDPDEDGGSEAPQTEDDENDGTEVPRDESGEPDDNVVTRPADTEADDQPNGANRDDEGACPQSCPIGDVMVCARCSHGVYRTFMSACYMRMFKCHNPSEKLELVSRHACIGSAPYLGEMARPNQNLGEPQDKDSVLNYVFASRNSEHWD